MVPPQVAAAERALEAHRRAAALAAQHELARNAEDFLAAGRELASAEHELAGIEADVCRARIAEITSEHSPDNSKTKVNDDGGGEGDDGKLSVADGGTPHMAENVSAIVHKELVQAVRALRARVAHTPADGKT